MNYICLSILSPIVGFLYPIFAKKFIHKKFSVISTIIPIVVSTIVSILSYVRFIKNNETLLIFTFCNWIQVDTFHSYISFTLDKLSCSMMTVIHIIGLLTSIFSIWYIKREIFRFISYINLFIASMSILVLANDFLLIYVGWECVGICSYLLINFYIQKTKTNIYASKALITTRIGDIFLLIAIFIIFYTFKTVMISQIREQIIAYNINNITVLYLIPALIFIGSVGKSAQFPLQIWLSDAMVGPTPVSALIHSATMVTAGIYLIVRTNFMFSTPYILHFISVIGSITLILSGCLAVLQKDLKKILAYSTINQISYMYLSISVKAYYTAIMHLINHAFFKSLLFFSAATIIRANNTNNIFELNLNKIHKNKMLIYAGFLFGSISLLSVPILTSSFYSKREILKKIFENNCYLPLIIIYMIGCLLTGIYTFRMFFTIFHKRKKQTTTLIHTVSTNKYIFRNIPIVILIIFSTSILFAFTKQFLDKAELYHENSRIKNLEYISYIMYLCGIIISYVYDIIRDSFVNDIQTNKLYKFITTEFGTQYMYNTFRKLYLKLSLITAHDPLKNVINIINTTMTFLGKASVLIENSKLNSYTIAIVLCVICLILIKDLQFIM